MDAYNLTISFTIAALVVSISDIFFTKIQGRMGKKQNFIFMCLLIIIALNSICNIITAVFRPYVNISQGAMLAATTARYFYFVFHTALAPMFFFYVGRVCGVTLRTNPVKRYFFYGLFALTELMAILNPLTKWVYYTDADFVFHRNWGEMAIYAAAGIYFVVSMIFLMTTWKAMTVKRRTGIVLFALITLIGIVIQFISTDFKVELFAEAIGFTGIMIIIENEEDRIDSNSNVYNRSALIMDMDSFIINKNPFYSICVRITTPEIISRQSTGDNTDAVERVVAEYLQTVVKRYSIYRTRTKNFVIILFTSDREYVMNIAKEIRGRFEKPWKLSDSMVLLSTAIQVTNYPGMIASTNEALYMFDSPVPEHGDGKIFAGEDLNYLVRRMTVEKAISKSLAKHQFEVYYQPTYSISDLKLHGAEALIRMHNDDYGLIYPDEFISVAEENGLIDSIDDFVLLDVCDLIKTEHLENSMIDCINVNLSVVQCMKPGFVDHIKGIVEAAGVDKNLINFEITESLSASSYEILNGVVSGLKGDGFKFSMDDYGTGYSNMRALASMDFDVIKIDKSILWEAEKSELGEIILKNNIRMIHQMRRKILVEGVETEAQIELLKPLGVNYLQGFFFSKPVTRAEFLKLLREAEAAEAAEAAKTAKPNE